MKIKALGASVRVNNFKIRTSKNTMIRGPLDCWMIASYPTFAIRRPLEIRLPTLLLPTFLKKKILHNYLLN